MVLHMSKCRAFAPPARRGKGHCSSAVRDLAVVGGGACIAKTFDERSQWCSRAPAAAQGEHVFCKPSPVRAAKGADARVDEDGPEGAADVKGARWQHKTGVPRRPRAWDAAWGLPVRALFVSIAVT